MTSIMYLCLVSTLTFTLSLNERTSKASNMSLPTSDSILHDYSHMKNISQTKIIEFDNHGTLFYVFIEFEHGLITVMS